MIGLLNRIWRRLKFTNSKSYWESRYQKGGNSGFGSYGRLAKFKAEVLNDFVAKNSIQSVMEFGCGDGNQLKLAVYPKYIGLDVSPEAIKRCIGEFQEDLNKSFFLYDQDCFQDPIGLYKADLCMSLDVIYHLVEDSVFETYMENLFNASNKWVVIYSSDRDRTYHGSHVRERAFTEWINSNRPGWKLEEKIDNPYPLEPGNPVTSFANFYFFLNETRKSD